MCHAVRDKHSHSDQVQIRPHFLQEIVEVPLVMCGNGYCVRDLVNNV